MFVVSTQSVVSYLEVFMDFTNVFIFLHGDPTVLTRRKGGAMGQRSEDEMREFPTVENFFVLTKEFPLANLGLFS